VDIALLVSLCGVVGIVAIYFFFVRKRNS